MKPPLGVANSYAQLLRAWLDELKAYVLEHVLAGWERNPVHARFNVPSATRTDSEFVHRKIAGIRVQLEQRLDPAKIAPKIEIFAKRVSTKNGEELRRVIGISTVEIRDRTSIVLFQDRNIALIKSLAGKQITEIRTLLERAEIGAWRVEELRSKIQDQFKVAKSKADLLARDQVLKFNGELTKTRQTAAGIRQYIWTTSNDERVRPDHAVLDGTTQSWSDPPIVDESEGRTGHPGEDYQCRCTPYPVLDEAPDDLAPSRVPLTPAD